MQDEKECYHEIPPPRVSGRAVRDDPVVIGALGGSGTRVVARIARAGGVFMGSRLNRAEDSVPMMEFYDAWLHRYLERDAVFSAVESIAAEEQFRARLEDHLAGFDHPAAKWGVKVPRSILMLGYWQQRFPRFKFVHLIRSGLDMAYSDDRYQIRMFGHLVLTEEERGYDDPIQAMAYWRRVNASAASFGEREMDQRYLRMRFEDLCSDSDQACLKLGRFLGVPELERLVKAGGREITPPATLDRWQNQSAEEVAELKRVGGDVLECFGYLNT